MKTIIIALALAFTVTTSNAQGMTCRPVGPNTVCSPTPAGGGAGIGQALVVIGVIYLLMRVLTPDEPTDKSTDE
jgi:hypothetical protein